MHGHMIILLILRNPTVIDSGSYRTRKTLKSWLTATTKNADNNSMLLPGQYTMLTKK